MNYYELEEDEEEKALTSKKKKQHQSHLLLLILGAGIGYYFLLYLPKKRNQAIAEIKTMLENNPHVNLSDLDAKLWNSQENWEEYLTDLYLNSQIQQFTKQMKGAIKAKAEELEKSNLTPEQIKDIAIKEIEDGCSEEEREWQEIKNILKNYAKKIKNSPIDDISTLQKEANELIVEERVKKQGLHWERKIEEAEKSWIDRELIKFVETFKDAWIKKQRDGGKKASFNAPYKIKFSPSLWNELTEEQKQHEKAEELKLDPRVDSYEFNDKITDWYNKVELNPARGEKDPQSQKDNNALLYGAGGTGKSITVEKLAYKADIYPLVVIQGSALTPKLPDQKYSIAVFEKFIFTIADINWTLIDDFGYERAEGGEVRYILFVDEADQISENSFAKESTGLTFLKECMGSDDYKRNESWNLWIMATNHLKKVDEAAYRSGRLSNPLDFSWTLGDFLKYADKAGISSQFPEHWLNDAVLNDEDNKWVNRFNTMNFKDEFLPFWSKFTTNNPNAEYEPEKNEENNEERNENNDQEIKDKKIKIKWGEMFEFFWRLKDSSQLGSFNGKFINPRQPKIEEIVDKNLISVGNQISKTISIRLKELMISLEETKNQLQTAKSEYTAMLENKLADISLMISQMK